MKKQSSIVILIIYFGPLPWYFPYFIQSCKYNSEVDFIIFSDAGVGLELPSNVKIICKSLADIRQLASEKFGFSVRLDFPYKLCDYKPAYGLIFEDYIQDYTFWAQSDIDIIYGSLVHFFDEELLDHVDYCSVRHDYTTGCFSLFRNNSIMNNLFKSSVDYKKVFTTPEHCGFEELNFKHCEISDENKKLEDIDTEIECFTHVIKKAQQQKLINAHFDFIVLEGVPGRIKFDHGILTYKNEFEAALYHLYWLKKVYNPVEKPDNIPESYYISPTKIYFKKSVQQ